ncbi:MAG: WD40 repeat protein, partial [Pirellulaceae bacterium]
AKALTTDVDFEQTPFTHPIFADDASIFVLKGPAVPAQLGAILTDEDLHNARIPGEPNKKLPEQTLHLWNWNESSTSRVTSIPAIHGTTALSPDGTELLHSSGVTVDTQTGNSRKLKGFEVNIGERICKLKFSPAGRYVLAWLLPEAAPKNTQLRIIDITEEKVMAQFAAGWYAAFNPSESVVVYTRPVPNTPRTDAIQRFDLQPQQQAALQSVLAYTPLFEIHEAEQLTTADTTMESVGVTVSPDGKLLAVSYSYGKVFIWELESAKLVSYKRLFRKGKRDKFFAAKQMRFSPDGKLLAMASGSRLKIIQTADGEQIAEHYDRATPQIAHMRWSADSQQIQLLSYSTIKTLRSGGGAESVASEMLPRLYRWNWKTGPPLPTPHISHDEQ